MQRSSGTAGVRQNSPLRSAGLVATGSSSASTWLSDITKTRPLSGKFSDEKVASAQGSGDGPSESATVTDCDGGLPLEKKPPAVMITPMDIVRTKTVAVNKSQYPLVPLSLRGEMILLRSRSLSTSRMNTPPAITIVITLTKIEAVRTSIMMELDLNYRQASSQPPLRLEQQKRRLWRRMQAT